MQGKTIYGRFLRNFQIITNDIEHRIAHDKKIPNVKSMNKLSCLYKFLF